MAKRGRPSRADRLKRLAADYVGGANKGKWLAACEAAGLFVDQDSPEAVAALADVEVALAEIAIASKEEHTESEWVQMAKRLAHVIEDIATGKVQASAAQVRAITEIQTRAYGRVTMSSSDKAAPAGIVILPTLLDGEVLRICPVCKARELNENPR